MSDLLPSSWPVRAAVRHPGPLYHRGQMAAGDGSHARSSSLEGPCLSCAPDLESADAWRSIARLGGLPLWSLSLASGFLLLDFYRVPAQRLFAEAARLGLVEPAVVFRVTSYDSELESKVFSEYATLAEAQAEQGEVDEGRKLQRRASWAPTAALRAYWRSRHAGAEISLVGIRDAAGVALGDLYCPGLDGVLWRERLDPAAFSAPRVGLFQRTLPQVTRLELPAR